MYKTVIDFQTLWKHLIGLRLNIVVIDIYSMYVCLKRQLDLLDYVDLIDCSLCIAIEIIISLLLIIKTSPEINWLTLSLVVST